MAKTLIFDLGGVLVDLNWERVCAPLTELSKKRAADVRREVSEGSLARLLMLGQLSSTEFHRRLCQTLGIEIEYEAFLGIWVRLLSANEEIVPLVERLKENHPLVLASNTDEIHFTYSKQQFGVLNHFDQHFLSYQMGILKPDPQFFHRMLRDLGLPPTECVFIDDVNENVESARSLGITAIQFQGNQSLQTILAALL